MQETERPTTSYNIVEPVRQPSAPVKVARTPLRIRLSNIQALFPAPRVIAGMVGGWFVLFVILNTVATKAADKPKLSTAEPVGMSKIRASLSADEERRANIDSLTVYTTKFYESFAIYPSVSQINSIEFRKGNAAFKIANRRTYTDPKGSTGQFAQQPTKGAYFYAPTPLGCDNSNVPCSGYTIGATLDNGQLYTKSNPK